MERIIFVVFLTGLLVFLVMKREGKMDFHTASFDTTTTTIIESDPYDSPGPYIPGPYIRESTTTTTVVRYIPKYYREQMTGESLSRKHPNDLIEVRTTEE